MGAIAVQDKPLSGCHILIIEDDFYQAEDSRDYLSDAGAIIVECRGTIPDLDDLLADRRVDIALLDINLGHTQTFPLARALREKNIRCAFITGYDPQTLPRDLADVPVVTKPAEASAVIALVRSQLDGAAPGDAPRSG